MSPSPRLRVRPVAKRAAGVRPGPASVFWRLRGFEGARCKRRAPSLPPSRNRTPPCRERRLELSLRSDFAFFLSSEPFYPEGLDSGIARTEASIPSGTKERKGRDSSFGRNAESCHANSDDGTEGPLGRSFLEPF